MENQKTSSPEFIKDIQDLISKNYWSPELKERYKGVWTEVDRYAKRSQLYDSNAFVVMVIGPTKSGKSTLVNIMARNYVSPTNQTECTIRPSMITANEEPSLIVYKLKDRRIEDKSRALDEIVDHIKANQLRNKVGDLPDSEWYKSNILEVQEELSKDKLKKLVDDRKWVDDGTVMTGVEPSVTEGLLNDQDQINKVFIFDMPGFDGAMVNGMIENQNDTQYLYDAVTSRVDLIIFVQSSVSAFSESTKVFMNKLKESTNRKVPVYIVNNVYDSVYWRKVSDEEEAIKDAEDKNALAIVRSFDMIDPRNFISLNLGKINDYFFSVANNNTNAVQLREGFEDELKEAFEKYEKFEQEVLNTLTQNSDRLHSNFYNQLSALQNNVIVAIQDEIAKYNEAEKRKKDFKSKCDSFQKILNSITYDGEVQDIINSGLDPFVYKIRELSNYKEFDHDKFKTTVEDLFRAAANNINNKIKDSFCTNIYNKFNSEWSNFKNENSEYINPIDYQLKEVGASYSNQVDFSDAIGEADELFKQAAKSKFIFGGKRVKYKDMKDILEKRKDVWFKKSEERFSFGKTISLIDDHVPNENSDTIIINGKATDKISRVLKNIVYSFTKQIASNLESVQKAIQDEKDSEFIKQLKQLEQAKGLTNKILAQ
jgi:energy-coupling factor transporter ATP-binding protein EcfA2